MAALRLVVRLVLSFIILLILFFPLLITWHFRMHVLADFLRVAAFRSGCLLWGLQVRKEGAICTARPLLLVSNHFSYLDVFAIGSLLPARFTPKSEVATWPVIGFFSRILGCIFIDRRSSQILHNRSELDYALYARKSIISLFPEGTTNDGTILLPFKSSFLSMVEHRDVMVQAVSIIYTSLNGEPLTLKNRAIIGWYADMKFLPHLLEVLSQRSIGVTLRFHPPMVASSLDSRKDIARACHMLIAKDVILAE